MSRSPLMPNYPPQPVKFVRGLGSELWDDHGKRYLDFLSGIAVTSLGHSHPDVAREVASQARRLLHVSNLFANELAGEVAAELDRHIGGGGQVFFCNSGAEANEAALKLARKWGGPGRFEILTAMGSFHGRTLATLHATGQPAKHKPFEPLPEGFKHFAWEDLDSLQAAITDQTVAVLIEPILGEGGVVPGSRAFLEGVQELCDSHGLLFMVDEIQSGLCRTGRWFAFQHYGLDPDVVTMAKALGNGMPVGATWARADVAGSFEPGDHATTFGGQPLALSAVRKVLQVMERRDVAGLAARSGEYLRKALESIPGVSEVRGLGLLLAAELDGMPAGEAAMAALHEGLVVNAVTGTALRLAPSLLVTESEIEEAVAVLAAVLREGRS